MGLLYKCIGKGFTIGRHWKRVYYINVLEKGLLYKFIGKGFTIGRHWKWVYFINALEKGLR